MAAGGETNRTRTLKEKSKHKRTIRWLNKWISYSLSLRIAVTLGVDGCECLKCNFKLWSFSKFSPQIRQRNDDVGTTKHLRMWKLYCLSEVNFFKHFLHWTRKEYQSTVWREEEFNRPVEMDCSILHDKLNEHDNFEFFGIYFYINDTRKKMAEIRREWTWRGCLLWKDENQHDWVNAYEIIDRQFEDFQFH